uniref:Uncharacterized protein n=1 Tax=Verrucosispora sp. MS100047 TaxID=1410949 RepID=A0A097CSK9_9ACTN|nr:hypothetical protein VASRM7_403 [Verrucosispora sp. MS100047]
MPGGVHAEQLDRTRRVDHLDELAFPGDERRPQRLVSLVQQVDRALQGDDVAGPAQVPHDLLVEGVLLSSIVVHQPQEALTHRSR